MRHRGAPRALLLSGAPSRTGTLASRTAARPSAALSHVFCRSRLAGGRRVVACTGSLGHDTDDVRRFAEAGAAGLRRALQAGSKRPLLVVAQPPREARFKRAVEAATLGAASTAWRPLEARIFHA